MILIITRSTQITHNTGFILTHNVFILLPTFLRILFTHTQNLKLTLQVRKLEHPYDTSCDCLIFKLFIVKDGFAIWKES